MIVNPVMHLMLHRIILVDNAINVIPSVGGQEEDSTTQDKPIAPAAMRVMLQPTITLVNAQIAIAQTWGG